MLLEGTGTIHREPPTELELAILRRELALEKRAAELRRDAAITFFKPHPLQEFFYANASYHYRYARTGNRFGKSEMGAAEDVAFALGYRPWYPKGHPLRTLGIPSHPTKGLIVCTTWKKSREVFTETEAGALGKLFKYIPRKDLVEYSKNHSGFIDRFVVRHHKPDGSLSGGYSVIFIDTIEGFKKNPLAQESSVHDWVHVDEPIPEQMWKAIARGLVDRGGRAWFTCTPLTEPWIDDAFCPDEDDATQDKIQFAEGDRFMMTGSMEDNPHNKQEDIDRFMAWLTPEERECRKKGIPLHLSGIVYKEFDRNLHLKLDGPPLGWNSWAEPPKDYCLRYAIDYHPRKNDAVLFLATAPDGYIYAYHEIWASMLAEDESKAIKKVLNGHIAQPGLVDPLASTPNKVTGITQLQEYRRCGLAVLPATKDPDNGIRAVKALLKSRDKAGKPIFYVAPHLKRFLFEITRGFIWKEETDKPEKVNDDMMENFYRLTLQGLGYIEPPSLSDYIVVPPREILPMDINPFEFDASPAKKESKFDPLRYRS